MGFELCRFFFLARKARPTVRLRIYASGNRLVGVEGIMVPPATPENLIVEGFVFVPGELVAELLHLQCQYGDEGHNTTISSVFV